ncbi:MAG: repair protein RadC [Verrucomicrobiota bacterium]|jgi:DNA repair protein RadC
MSVHARIHDLPAQDRPRERFLAQGADKASKVDLIAILLRTGLKGMSALHVAEQILNRFRTLECLARASIEELCEIKGVGPDKAVTLKAAFTLARQMAAELRNESPLVDTPERVADLVREQLRHVTRETFLAVLLNTRRRLIKIEELSNGTLDTILVHARDVFRAAILANAAAIVIIHNHPSGDPSPSESDIKVTRDLIRAGQLLKIELLDHVILGRATQERIKDWVSLKELGYFAG